MEINTNSWHYRLTAIFWSNVSEKNPTSLCVYFWQFVSVFVFAMAVVLIELNILVFSFVRVFHIEPVLSFFYKWGLNYPVEVDTSAHHAVNARFQVLF